MSKPTANLFLDSRHPKKNGKYPVKLTIYFDEKKKRYNIHFDFTKEEWNKINQSKLRDETLKESKMKLNAILEKACQVIDNLPDFSFYGFEIAFFRKRTNKKDVFGLFKDYIDNLKEQERINTANSYQDAYNAFKAFFGRENIRFNEITPEVLMEFEKKWLGEKKSITSVGMYTRALRVVFNQARNSNLIQEKDYPFGKHKYTIPAGTNTKKALPKNTISIIINYPAEPMSQEHFAKDIWVFSYLCNGINLRDIALLKYKDIKNDSIEFVRQKTRQTTRGKFKPVTAILLPETKKIIETWGVKPSIPDNYVFPILENNLTKKLEVARVKQANKTINKYLNSIAKKKELGINLTTYTARHSFATQLKSSGASTEFISESLGHSSLAVTENYLASFNQEEKKKWAEKLMDL
jgi:integrase